MSKNPFLDRANSIRSNATNNPSYKSYNTTSTPTQKLPMLGETSASISRQHSEVDDFRKQEEAKRLEQERLKKQQLELDNFKKQELAKKDSLASAPSKFLKTNSTTGKTEIATSQYTTPVKAPTKLPTLSVANTKIPVEGPIDKYLAPEFSPMETKSKAWISDSELEKNREAAKASRAEGNKGSSNPALASNYDNNKTSFADIKKMNDAISKETDPIKKATLRLTQNLGYIMSTPDKLNSTGRALQTARNIQETRPEGEVQKDTGNVVTNFIADLAGSIIGYSVLGGSGFNMGGASGAIEGTIAKTTGKTAGNYAVNKVVNKAIEYGIKGVGSGTELAGLSGVQSSLAGTNTKQTVEAMGKGFVTGAIWGVGGKALGEAGTYVKTELPKKMLTKKGYTEVVPDSGYWVKYSRNATNNTSLSQTKGQVESTFMENSNFMDASGNKIPKWQIQLKDLLEKAKNRDEVANIVDRYQQGIKEMPKLNSSNPINSTAETSVSGFKAQEPIQAPVSNPMFDIAKTVSIKGMGDLEVVSKKDGKISLKDEDGGIIHMSEEDLNQLTKEGSFNQQEQDSKMYEDVITTLQNIPQSDPQMEAIKQQVIQKNREKAQSLATVNQQATNTSTVEPTQATNIEGNVIAPTQETIQSTEDMQATEQIADVSQTIDNSVVKDNLTTDNSNSDISNSDEIKSVKVNSIGVDPQRFQFKADMDLQNGTGQKLSGAETFDKLKANTITVWQDNQGKNWVVNGHHRVELANRTGTENINAILLKESEGYSDKQAREIGALQNISEGMGTAKDAAQVFREGNYTIDELREEGLSLKDKFIEQGYNIAQLNDRLYHNVVNENLNYEKASMIGKEFPNNSKENDSNQNAVMDYIQTNNPNKSELSEAIYMIKSAQNGMIDDIQENQQMSLDGLGNNNVMGNNFASKMKLISELKHNLTSDKNVFNKAIKKSDVLSENGNVLNTDANAKRKELLDNVLKVIDQGKGMKGDPINEILNAYASRIGFEGLNIKTAVKNATNEIIDYISNNNIVEKINNPVDSEQISMFGGNENANVEQGNNQTSIKIEGNKQEGTGKTTEVAAGTTTKEVESKKETTPTETTPNKATTEATTPSKQLENTNTPTETKVAIDKAKVVKKQLSVLKKEVVKTEPTSQTVEYNSSDTNIKGEDMKKPSYIYRGVPNEIAESIKKGGKIYNPNSPGGWAYFTTLENTVKDYGGKIVRIDVNKIDTDLLTHDYYKAMQTTDLLESIAHGEKSYEKNPQSYIKEIIDGKKVELKKLDEPTLGLSKEEYASKMKEVYNFNIKPFIKSVESGELASSERVDGLIIDVIPKNLIEIIDNDLRSKENKKAEDKSLFTDNAKTDGNKGTRVGNGEVKKELPVLKKKTPKTENKSLSTNERLKSMGFSEAIIKDFDKLLFEAQKISNTSGNDLTLKDISAVQYPQARINMVRETINKLKEVKNSKGVINIIKKNWLVDEPSFIDLKTANKLIELLPEMSKDKIFMDSLSTARRIAKAGYEDANSLKLVLVKAYGPEMLHNEKPLATLETKVETPKTSTPTRYYLTQRPPSIGTHPRGTTDVVAFDKKQYVDAIGKEAWGYIEYDKPLSDGQVSNYELTKNEPKSETKKELPMLKKETPKEIITETKEYKQLEPSHDRIAKWIDNIESNKSEASKGIREISDYISGKGKIQDLAVGFWRLNNYIAKTEVNKFSIDGPLARIKEFLKKNKIEVDDLTGDTYDSRLAANIVYSDIPEGDPYDGVAKITEMVKPIILQNGAVIQSGEVNIGAKTETPVKKESQDSINTKLENFFGGSRVKITNSTLEERLAKFKILQQETIDRARGAEAKELAKQEWQPDIDKTLKLIEEQNKAKKVELPTLKVKEPYELTKEEYKAQSFKNGLTELGWNNIVERQHRNSIASAIIEGKKVSDSVKNSYPDMDELVATKTKQLQEAKEAVKKNAEGYAKNAEIAKDIEDAKLKVIEENKIEAAAKQKEDLDRYEESVANRYKKTKKEYVGTHRGKAKELLEYEHEEAVKLALKEGKTVSKEVLKDYPGLMSKTKDLATLKPSSGLPERSSFEKSFGIDFVLSETNMKEFDKSSEETESLMATEIGRVVSKKLGTTDIEAIVKHFEKEYKLFKTTLTFDLPIGRNKPLGKATYNPLTKKSLVRVAKPNPKNIEKTIGYVMHELEHLKDLVYGYNPRTFRQNSKTTVYMGRSVGQISKDLANGHHRDYSWFEYDYLRKNSIIEALANGEKLSDDIMNEYPELKPVKNLESYKGKKGWEKPVSVMAANLGDTGGSLENVKKSHRILVEKAIANGENIPLEVLADYPDLVPKKPLAILGDKPKAKAKPKVKPSEVKIDIAEQDKQIEKITKKMDDKKVTYEIFKNEDGIVHIKGKSPAGKPLNITVFADGSSTTGISGKDGKLVESDKKASVNTEEVPSHFQGTPTGIGIVAPGFKQRSNTTYKGFEFEEATLEERYKASHGVPKKTWIEKQKENIREVINMSTRTFRNVPPTEKNSEFIKEMVQYPKLKNLSSDETIRILDDITYDLSKDTFNVFSRKVLLDDLSEEVIKGNLLPGGFTPESVAKELVRIQPYIIHEVEAALAKREKHWDAIKTDYIKGMAEIGIDVSDKFNRKNYFRHQVLEYMQAKNILGEGNKMKTPTNRGFSKERKGTEMDINTDYLQAEYEVMGQMIHDKQVAQMIGRIKGKYDVSEELKVEAKKLREEAKAKGEELKITWQDMLPEGYSLWQPREGNAFHFADSLPDKMVQELQSGLATEISVKVEDLKKVMALGGKYKEYAIPSEIADKLNELYKTTEKNVLSKASKKILGGWKQWVLTINPLGVIKYNIRNAAGDIDASMLEPGVLKFSAQSAREVYSAMKSGVYTVGLKEFRDLGGFEDLTIAQEIGDVNKTGPFDRFKEKKGLPNLFKAYTGVTSNVTNYRESILRYAAFMYYKKALAQGKIKYGTSNPALVKGLTSNTDKAYKLSKDLLGAYDEISETGQVLRDHWIPFFSWIEVNFKRYTQAFKNAASSDIAKEQLSSKGKNTNTFNTVAQVGKNLGSTTNKALLVTTMLALWNATMHSEDEDSLPTSARETPHIILGSDDEGRVVYFNRLGSFSDYLDWFSLDNIQLDIKDIEKGRKTIKDQLIGMAKAPVNKFANSITPFVKVPAELISGKKLYPDVFNTSTIRNKAQYLAQSASVGVEYNRIVGLPMLGGIQDDMSNAIVYKSDPKAAAYNNTLDVKRKFEATKGKEPTSTYATTPKSNALYYYKLALKYKDEKSASKWVKKYAELGGTVKGLEASLEFLNPLKGYEPTEYEKLHPTYKNVYAKVQEKESLYNEFMSSLDVKEKEQLNLAIDYYNDLVNASDSNQLQNAIDRYGISK